MISIRCNLNDLPFNKETNHSKEEFDQFARIITWHIKGLIQGAKFFLNKTITQCAAFVALEENMREFVRNSLDAFKHISKQDWFIIIKIPITPDSNQQATLFYLDTAGGFSNEFFKEKNCIDYYHDLLANNKISIKSQKNGSTDLGGCGVALSQTSRFLHQHAGSLKLDNTPHGARLQLTSPVHSDCSQKPSFNRFRGIDYQNLLAEMDRKAEQRTVQSKIEEKCESIKISQNHFVCGRAKRLGLTPLILPGKVSRRAR